MSTIRAAFPSSIDGLSGPLSMHFGHANAFTIVEYDEKFKVKHVEILKNAPHEHSMCQKPVNLLINSSINEIIIGGMGRKPVMLFQQANIKIYRGFKGTVKENFVALKEGKLQVMQDKDACQESIH